MKNNISVTSDIEDNIFMCYYRSNPTTYMYYICVMNSELVMTELKAVLMN